jgi:NAD(P)-dependent dehydrogenase (short-subunit alcohol dehydrogenase family)
VPRAETPEDLVGTTLFLASDVSRFFPGQIINANGGATHPRPSCR